MKSSILFIFIFLFSSEAFSFWGDKEVVSRPVEIQAYQRIEFIPGDIIRPVWKEARSNKKLKSYKVEIIMTGYVDKYGNEKKVSIGEISFDSSQIADLRRYKRAYFFDQLDNDFHILILNEFRLLGE